MKKTLIALFAFVSISLLSACSKLPGFSDCDAAADKNLLQEVFEKNLREVEPHHPLELGFCLLKDMKPQLCDIKVEVSDIKEVSKSSFSTTCKASLRYSASLRLDDYLKERQRQIAEINAKASAELAQAKQFTIETFKRFNVEYSDADLSAGIAKRESAIRDGEQAALARFNASEKMDIASIDNKIRDIFFNQSNASTVQMLEEPAKKSYLIVVGADYTVTQSKDYMNLNLDSLNLVAKGE